MALMENSVKKPAHWPPSLSLFVHQKNQWEQDSNSYSNSNSHSQTYAYAEICANTKAPPHAAAEAVTHSTLKAATRRSIAQHEMFRRSRNIPTNAQTVQFCYEILADGFR